MGHGHPQSEENKAKLLAVNLGCHKSPETRAKMSASHRGKPMTTETRTKMSLGKMGHSTSLETRARLSVTHWKGGAQTSSRKRNAKRRLLGFVSLSSWFEGCEAHHIDNERVIYMPKELHRSIYHRQTDGRGMEQINVLALQWLTQNPN